MKKYSLKKIHAFAVFILISLDANGQQLLSYNPMNTARSYLLAITNTFEEKKVYINPFCIIFNEHANSSFFKNDSLKTVTGPASNLLFAQTYFTPAQSLSPGSRTTKLAPLINSYIAPRISLKKTGFLSGIQYAYAPTTEWQAGFRAQLPFVKTRTTKQKPGLEGKSLFGGPVATDFYKTAIETVDGTSTPVNDFAIRLDFLSNLPASLKGPGTTISFVNYANPSTNTITMNGIDITDKQTTVTNRNPITVVFVPTNQQPSAPFGILLDPSNTPQPNTATTLPSLPANGITTAPRDRFDQSINYQSLGDNKTVQSQLWAVPSVIEGPPTQLTQNANIIGNNIKNIVANINQTPEQIFQDYGISFADSTTTSIGDIAAEFFLDYFFTQKIYGELLCGISLPTGKTVNKTKNAIFSFATGSNGHTGLYFGINSTYKPSEWFTIVSSGMINFFLNATEYIPVSFKGASVKNFNQLTEATKSWNSINFTLDGHFHLPSYYKDTMTTTCIVGYELYHKYKDTLSFFYPTVTDATGNIQPTDSRVAAFKTDRHTHTVSIKVMLTFFEKINIFGGWHRTVYGINTPKSNGWHIGLETYI